MAARADILARTRPDGDCRLWLGAADRDGYGLVRHGGRLRGAHRVAYALAVGQIPRGQIVRHRCDRPACVRPDHLEVGTHADNVRDAIERGRWRPRGRSGVPRWRLQAGGLYIYVLDESGGAAEGSS